jgi:hypothetical protein
VLCMRVESPKPSTCRLGGWIHVVEDATYQPTTLPKKEKPTIDWHALAQAMFESATAAEERNYLAKTLGLKESALGELKVGRGWDDYRHLPYSSWPEKDATGRVVGIVRRYRDGAKKTMRHSSHGLYYSANLIRQRSGPILLPEGGSDTAALLGLGLNVIGRPSNLGGVDQLTELLAACSNTIIVLGERDEKHTHDNCHGCLLCWPGLAGARETAKRLGAALKRTVHWTLPEGKDVRAWLNGREVTAAEFLGELRAWRAESATLRLGSNIGKPKGGSKLSA